MNKPFELPTVIGAIKQAVNMDLDPLGRPRLLHFLAKNEGFYQNQNEVKVNFSPIKKIIYASPQFN